MRHLRSPFLIGYLAITLGLSPTIGFSPAFANPQGGQVVGGTATVQGQGTSTVTVNQASDRAIINWNTFNLSAGDLTRFVQPGTSSIALNRVTGGLGPSQIFGTIQANGRVFLVNPNGVLFGQGAVIDTSGFLATTHDIKNDDFMAGKNNFTIPGNPAASIVNLGTITANNGGIAALVAPGVRNSGTIIADFGKVAMASGNNGFTLDFYGDKLITLQVNDSVATQVVDVATQQPLSALVKNEGLLKANGGRVELSAAAARQVVDSVINNTGVIEANTVGTKDGMIVLGAATAADKPDGAPAQNVKIAGTISAAGKNAGEKGGKIQITGEKIALAGTKIDASGKAGGGKVLIGGDVGGGKGNAAVASIPQAALESTPVATASTVTVDAATLIDVSAKDIGSGGKLVVWSDNLTSFAGSFQARGGATGGDGGFAEVSSKGVLSYNGFGDLRAPAGKFGTLLLDPESLLIGHSTDAGESSTTYAPPADNSVVYDATLNNALMFGSVLVTTGTGPTGVGNITLAEGANVNWGNSSSLTLSAYRDIIFNGGAAISNTGAGSLILRADNTGRGTGTVSFASANQINYSGSTGKVSIFYNVYDGYSCLDCQDNYLTRVATNSAVPNQSTAYMLVNSYWDLQNINSNLSGRYAIGRNIDGRDYPNFTPIGSVSSPFTGIFDGQYVNGQGPSISNLNIAPTASGISSIGLFAVNAGTIQNLNLTGINVSANPNVGLPGQFVGTLAGQNYGTISNVSVGGSVNGGTSQGVIAGGLVGQNGVFWNYNTSGTPGSINYARANVAVSVGDGVSCNGSSCNGGWNSAGGLVGSNVAGSLISYSSAEGNVSGGSGSSLGGLVGQNGFGGQFPTTGYIESSWASGNVTSLSGVNVMLGGLVGYNAPGSYIYDSSASGNVTGAGTVASCSGNSFCQFINAGGLVGQNQGFIVGSSEGEGNLSYSYYAAYEGYPYWTSTYASGAVHVGQNGTAGGLVGWNDGVIAYAGASGRVTGAAGTGGTTSDGSTTTLGGLAGSNQGLIIGSFATGIVGNSNVNNLQVGGLVGSNSGSILASGAWNGYFEDSFNVVGVQAGNNSQAGGLVGSNGPTSFDCGTCTWGDGHNNFGLVFASGAYSNVKVGTGSVAGGLAGSNDGIINNSAASGSVTGGADSVLGGLVGAVTIPANPTPPASAPGDNYWSGLFSELVSVLELQNGVSASSASGAVTSTGPNSVVGGLVGVSGGTIVDSWSSGAVSGTSESFLGGLVGINLGLVQNSWTIASASVTGTGNNVIGGLVGLNLGTIDPSNAAGDVWSPNSIAGSLVGANAMFVNFAPNQILGSQFPVGTIVDTNPASAGTGTVNGAPGPQVGASNPTTGLPNYPSIVQGCNDPLCTALTTGIFGPIDQNPVNPPPPLQTIFNPDTTNFGGNSSPTPINLNQGNPPSGGNPPGNNNNNNPPPRTGPPPGQGIGRTLSEQQFSGVPPLGETRFLPGEVVVQISNSVSADRIQQLAKQFGFTIISSQAIDGSGRTIYRFSIGGGKNIRDIILALEKNQVVASAQPNYVFGLAQDVAPQPVAPQDVAPPPTGSPDNTGSLPPSTELSSEQQADMAARTTLPAGDSAQYTIDKLHLGAVHLRSVGRNVSVAVIDSEIDTQHPDLVGVVSEQFDATGTASNPHVHGTGMAGAIASKRRLLGIAPGVRILAVKAFDETSTSAEATSYQILKGLDWAISKHVRIINMSFAGPRDLMMERSLQKAYDQGIVLIAAAGNAGPKSPPLYPAADANVIAVSATDYADKPFKMANRGKYIAVAAPGVDVLVPAPKGAYQLTTGTSVAAAHVSGVAALLLESRPTLTPKDVRAILMNTAKVINPKGKDDVTGAGLVDPYQALTMSTARAADIAPAGRVPTTH